jgi:F-type H+-transporting ATPase subunit b
MKRLALAVVLLLVAAALPMLAEEGKGTKEGANGLWAWANFLLLAGGLGYVAWKNGRPYFAARSLQIRKGMIEAQELRAEADAKVADVERRLANLDAEIEALRREALAEQEAEAQRARRDAAAEMAKIEARVAEEIAAAGKSARLELRRYSTELALALAEKKIAAHMSPALQNRLVDITLEQLAQPVHTN